MSTITEWDFLDSCSHTEWKFPADLASELSQKHGHVTLAEVFVFIERLQDKQYLEAQKVLDPTKHKMRLGVRKTSAGIKARHEAHQNEGVPDIGPRLKPA